MGWNQEKHLQYGLMFDDGCITQGIPDNKSKDSPEISDFKSCQNCGDIANVLPNDPFGMVFTMVSPKEAFENDISACLPKDPFGTDFKTIDHLNMDLNIEATVAAITEWIVDFVLEADELEYEKAFEYKNMDDYEILTELHFVWTGLLKPEEEDNQIIEARNVDYEDNNMFGGEAQELMNDDARADACAPSDALYLALGYLSITDLLNVEGVCKSMRDAVRNDTLLWQNIKIDSSMNLKMTDERLMSLTDRALRSLNLFSCFNITGVGLRHVLERNLRLTKLDVAGCRKVKVEGLLRDLKVFNTINSPGIKYLRVGELDGLTNQHVNEFQGLLSVNREGIRFNDDIPRYHFYDQLHLSLDNERALDVETCPKCKSSIVHCLVAKTRFVPGMSAKVASNALLVVYDVGVVWAMNHLKRPSSSTFAAWTVVILITCQLRIITKTCRQYLTLVAKEVVLSFVSPVMDLWWHIWSIMTHNSYA